MGARIAAAGDDLRMTQAADDVGTAAQHPMRPRGSLLATLAALAAFGPLSLDFYLPSFPTIAADLDASPSQVQLTFAACLLGLAVGQLFYGPLSDRFGRRPPLLVGLAVFTVASLLCAVAPDIRVLAGLRLLQGLGGCAGIVIGRAIVRDSFSGKDLSRAYSIVTSVAMTAPLLAPSLGAVLLRWAGWQWLFVVLALFGTVCAVAVVRLPETHPSHHRTDHGAIRAAQVYLGLLRRRAFLVPASLAALSSAALLGYVGSSSLIFIDQYGASPQAFALIFMVMAGFFVLGGQINMRLVQRYSARRIVVVALAVEVASLTVLTVLAARGAPLGLVLVVLAVPKVGLGALLPNAVAETMRPFPGSAGSASALMGTAQMGGAALVAVALARLGTPTMATTAAIMMGLMAIGLALSVTMLRPADSR